MFGDAATQVTCLSPCLFSLAILCRYADPRFGTWHNICQPLIKRSFAATELAADDECAQYFNMSFGSVERLDYGTGHELNFVAFL